MPTPPKLFISYSHDSPEHKKMVLDLAERFRKEKNIDCELDQHFEPGNPPEGWIKWMRDGVNQSDSVIMIFTPTYKDRYERNVDIGGNGVGYEGVVISQLLYQKYFTTNKFIPVICDNGELKHVTEELCDRNVYKVPSDFYVLADLIKGKRYNPLPPLAEIKAPEYPASTETAQAVTSGGSQRDTELAYLGTLLDAEHAQFTQNNYITLSGDFQSDGKRIPNMFMASSFKHQSHHSPDEAHERIQGESTYCDDLISAFRQYKRLVILGEPGAGKTFSLWKIAAESANKALTDENAAIPVVIPLNKWTDENQSLDSFVLQQMGSLAPYYPALFKAGRLLPLLDALNEIPFDQRAQKLPQVKTWINQKFSHLLLSCRERDYGGDLVQALDRLDIEPLSPPRVHDFLCQYFGILFQGSPQGQQTAEQLFWELAGGESMQQAWEHWQDDRPEWKVRLHSTLGNRWLYSNTKERVIGTCKRLNHLWKPYTPPDRHNFWEEKLPDDWYWAGKDHPASDYFSDSRRLMKLAQNPYLLNLIVSIYHRDQQLPSSRYQLFDSFVSDLLRREVKDHEKVQAKPAIPDQEALLDSLKRLAWQLQGHAGADEARTTLSRDEVAKHQLISPDQLQFAASASLLELTNQTVRFSHQLLQEYFTAQSFEARIANGLKASELWLKENWWETNGWEEAAKLAADYDDNPIPFLHWLAEGQPRLAAEIAREQQLLDQKQALFSTYKAQWQAAITDVERYPNPHERHAISTVLAWLGWDNRAGIGLNEQGLPDIHWLEVPAGEFIYGEDDAQQTLHLDTFYVSQYPVTNAQFKVFVESGAYDDPQWWEGLEKEDEPPEHEWTESNRPVELVNWFDAIAYCRWLSAQTGLDIQLPTELHWEKMARGAEGLAYPWGADYVSGNANVDEVWKKDGPYYLKETSAVGIYTQTKTPCGAMDTSGNVWEWCVNKYDDPEVTTIDRSDDWRVVRGGAWNGLAEYCRSAFRLYRHPLYRHDALGFRLLCFSSPMTDR
ncbi:SUMF1/EgtB/PvdO family nonheme iron enzyme [Leucothrix pacifica]|uniref:SEFIR domain-containing protein n=1 Tax=Leucothrix pacifica TaxID=1247513 RepID=A0A317CCF2_9GAMM|nr:SUMF1/EgtB/PvdO family nonheme iron enzyme [Leucothrix pacifica]PWQ96057.1 hypothetical protein DKW60_13470 [Leucothrix pacifica]